MNVNVTIPAEARRLTEVDLCAWIGTTTPGDQIVYHNGFLALDRDPATSRLSATTRNELKRLARRALFAAERGLIALVQRRNGPNDYTYLAIARRRPRVEHVVQLLAEQHTDSGEDL